MDTQQEEARRCPSCETPGTFLNKRRAPNAPRGTMVELYECRNDRCPDFIPPQTADNGDRMPPMRYRWYVQINPDGSIPPKGTGGVGPKAFDTEPDHTQLAQRARDQLRLLAAQDERGANNQAHEISSDLSYRGGY